MNLKKFSLCVILSAAILGLSMVLAANDQVIKDELSNRNRLSQPSKKSGSDDSLQNLDDSNDASLFMAPIRFFWSPFKSILQHSRRLFESPIDSTMDNLNGGFERVNDGIDQVRLQTFTMFMRLYNKSYSPEEIPRRMALFFERRKAIQESARMFDQGLVMFRMKENTFVDWDDDELKKLAGVSMPAPEHLLPEEKRIIDAQNSSSISSPSVKSSIADLDDEEEEENEEDYYLDDDTFIYEDNMEENLSVGAPTVKAEIPATKDWRDSGCVAPPINQLKCGACYAISTMNTIETMRCLNRVSSPILSPQQIVDCATERNGYANFGCDGGWPTRVLKYLQDTGIAAREACYPFQRRQNRQCLLRNVQSSPGCTVNANPYNDRTIRYKILNNERDILYHVANTGPVITVMKASDKFVYYGSGIFDDRTCSRKRDDVDHAIVIVGYGRENGVDYWIIKNSWGTESWGENGYGKYKRGTNVCSIGHWGWVILKN